MNRGSQSIQTSPGVAESRTQSFLLAILRNDFTHFPDPETRCSSKMTKQPSRRSKSLILFQEITLSGGRYRPILAMSASHSIASRLAGVVTTCRYCCGCTFSQYPSAVMVFPAPVRPRRTQPSCIRSTASLWAGRSLLMAYVYTP